MKFSILVRRTHMYLALFFVPWVLIYSLSTLFFNHGIRHFTGEAESRPISFEKESEQVYSRTLEEGMTPQEMARDILADLNLSGTHSVRKGPDGSLVINRRSAISPRRITYQPESGKLLIEKQVMSFPTWLRTIHHRAGFTNENAVEDGWALSVDIVILAMVFWVLSGLWMYWEIRAARTWGFLFGLAGAGLFVFLLMVL